MQPVRSVAVVSPPAMIKVRTVEMSSRDEMPLGWSSCLIARERLFCG